MKKLLLCTFLLSLFTSAISQDSLNLKKLSIWVSPNASRYNDIWGYSANGREYAILGSNWGTHFIDITNPTTPVEINSFIGRNSNVTWRDFKVSGNYAYGVADNNGNSLQIFDLSNLPTSVTKVYDEDSLSSSSHNIFIEGNRIYLPSNSRNGPRPLDVLSIANPTNPTLIGNFSSSYFGNCVSCLHDIYVKNDTAYCSAGTRGLYIYDFTNLNSPNQISSLTTYSEQGYNHASWVNEDYGVMVMADETHGSGLKSVDVSDLINPSEVDVFRTAPGAIPHNPFIRGTEAIVSYYHDGVQIFDLSDPANVTQKAFYDTHPDLSDSTYSGYQGNWGVYPFFESKNIIASDVTYGLFVLGKENDVAITGSDVTICKNDTLNISYDITGNFNTGNSFYLEFSDTNGYFISTQLIDSIQSTSAGIFTSTIPSSIVPGKEYKVRVRSSSPAIIDGNYIHITILNTTESSSSITICEGDSITIGSNTYFAEGTYVDIFNGSQCDSIVTTTIDVDTLPIPTIFDNGNTLLTLSPLTSGYQWYLNGNPLIGDTLQELNYISLGYGNYHVDITRGNCSLSSEVFKYEQIDNLSEENYSFIKIYPNPSTGKITLENKSSIPLNVEIITATGELISSFEVSDVKTIELSKGMYYFKMFSENRIFGRKLFIE